MFVNRVALTVSSYPISESPLDSSSNIIAQLLRPAQRSLTFLVEGQLDPN
jgi:hypothetical protein